MYLSYISCISITCTQGENARLSSFVGAIAISDLIKTTLGPCGLDKILQKVGPHDQTISVTNDGATILQSIHIDNAAAKVLVDIAKVQDSVVGDGTTSVAVLAGELLREAESLVLGNSSSGGGTIQRIHPQIVCAGWQLARTAALDALAQAAIDAATTTTTSSASSASASTSDSHQEQQRRLRMELLQIATTTLSSKLLTHEKEHFATLAVDAVLRLAGSNNLDHIQMIKIPGGSLRDSYLEEGFLLLKLPGVGQPTLMGGGDGGGGGGNDGYGARILLANTSMDTDKIKIYGSRVKVTSLDTISEIERAEKDKMKQKVHKILQHAQLQTKLPINCFINRQLIYNYPETLFTEAGIMAIEHADFDGMERLAAVLGGQIVSTFDTPELVTIGECQIIEQVRYPYWLGRPWVSCRFLRVFNVIQYYYHHQDLNKHTITGALVSFGTTPMFYIVSIDFDRRRKGHALWWLQRW
jgi:T-complex protein 1 subunit beta